MNTPNGHDHIFNFPGGTVHVERGRVVVAAPGHDVQVRESKTSIAGAGISRLFKLVAGQGIYLGYHPLRQDNGVIEQDREGQAVWHHFFAAPEDLQDKKGARLCCGFNSVVEITKGLGTYYGQYGGQYGLWRPAPAYILDVMHAEKNSGDLKGTFAVSTTGAAVYGSSTPDREHPALMAGRDFRDGTTQFYLKASPVFWRPVRSVASLDEKTRELLLSL